MPAATVATIRSMTFCNTDSVSRVLTIHIVASGGSASAANKIIDATTLLAGETLIDDALRNLATGDFITAFSDAANVLSMRVDGAELA